MLVSAVQRSESAICIPISPPSWTWPKGDKCFPCVLVQALQSLGGEVVRNRRLTSTGLACYPVQDGLRSRSMAWLSIIIVWSDSRRPRPPVRRHRAPPRHHGPEQATGPPRHHGVWNATICRIINAGVIIVYVVLTSTDLHESTGWRKARLPWSSNKHLPK